MPYKFARSYLMNYGLIQLNLDIPVPRRGICIVQNPQHPLSPAAKALLDMLMNHSSDTISTYSENEGNTLAF